MKSSDTAFRMAPLTMSGAAVPAVTRRSVLQACAAGAAGIVLSPAAHAQAVARDAVVIRSDSSPYVPTPQKVVDEMLRMGRLGAKDFIVDLGSGDGRIIITA
ncbi:MAG: twin-arginine translocation signal domain-containing protein, partial [Rhodocyclaceae bacterium]|nr:twin-arginine translocation signal domain-containing protein [Rhodocyclaceae bacterium]